MTRTRTHTSTSRLALYPRDHACADIQQGRESLSADTCGLTCYARCSHLLQRPGWGEKGEREREKKSSFALFSAFHTGRTKHPSPMSTRLVFCPSSPGYFSYLAVSLPTVARSGFLALSLSLSLSRASCFVSHPCLLGVRKSFRALNRLLGCAARPLLCKPPHPLEDKIMRSATATMPYVTMPRRTLRAVSPLCLRSPFFFFFFFPPKTVFSFPARCTPPPFLSN